MTTPWILLAILVLTTGVAPTSLGPKHYKLWQTGRSLVASIRVVSLTSVFSPAVCLSRCVEEDCTLLTLAVTSSSSGDRLDCHLTNVTDWLNNADVYLEPCNVFCKTFAATRMPHFYFPLDGGNQLRDLGFLRLRGRKRTLRYSLGESGNPFTCTGPSGNPHVKYLLNNLGTNNYLITDLNEQWQPTQGLTLAIWVMFPDSLTAGPIFEFYSNDQLVMFDHHFWFWSNPGQLYYNIPGQPGVKSSTMSMNSNQWHHVAMTWRPDGELLFYLNATQIRFKTIADPSFPGYRPSYLVIGVRIPSQDYLRACFA